MIGEAERELARRDEGEYIDVFNRGATQLAPGVNAEDLSRSLRRGTRLLEYFAN